ncbi:hypothetical protein [Loigolactobacillus backii]|uniref:hypothetical protein n=1 Tax=Loigolactobacillus backii TaxID=375175 RepID=UPI0007F083D8|nr:hypothetical protein [Loigolactobacillus backii]ANK66558.1 hypothetical protein AYR55_01925 [Loigolactobacillus backii]PIO87269.1 hypothetical protein B8A32_09075 [Loigolactobacillus backii]
MLGFLLVLFFAGIVGIIIGICLLIFNQIKTKAMKIPLILLFVSLILSIGSYQIAQHIMAHENVVTKKVVKKSSKKEPSLHLDGTAKYSDLHLTANPQRKAKISGTAKHTRSLTIRQIQGKTGSTKIKIKNNRFSTTVTLPNNNPKATYIISGSDNNNNVAVSEAIVKSANYDSEQTSIDQAAASSRAESSSNRTSSNATKYQAKLNSLNKGTAESAAYDSSTNTVTWIGFADWKTWSHSDLQKIMDILQAMTERQESNYGIQSVHIVVQLPDGTVIAKNSEADVDLQFVK